MITLDFPIIILQSAVICFVFGIGIYWLLNGIFNFTKTGRKSSVIIRLMLIALGILFINLIWPFLVVNFT